MWPLAKQAIFWLAIGLILVSCQFVEPEIPAEPTKSVPIHVWIGVSSDTPYLGEVAETFEAEGVIVHVVGAPAADLADDLTAGQIDAVIGHEIPEGAAWFNPLAVDGLSFVVHSQNPLAGIDLQQARQLLTGRTTNWSELGNPAQAVTLIVRERESAGRVLLADQLLTGQPVPVTARTLTSDIALRSEVAADPSALGIIWFGNQSEEIRLLAVDGVEPSTQTLAEQTSPLTVPIYFTADGEPQGALRLLLSWLQGPDGQTLIGERSGRVDR